MDVKYRRSRLWVNSGFQGRLLVRMVGYFLVYTFVVLHVGFVFEAASNFVEDGVHKGFGQLYREFLSRQAPLLFALVLTMPPLLYDMLKFSNRVAGPLFRCQRVMGEMADGKRVDEFHPRKGDLMTELFQAFNRLIHACNARQPANAPAAETVVDEPEVAAKG
ncbi:MAG: hypothetical protein U0736_24970 [Gemmataceae bacterium]